MEASKQESNRRSPIGKKISRRAILAGAVAGLAAPNLGRAQAQQIVIASGGGTLQEGQRTAFFTPFEKATGIKVVDTTGMSLAKVRSMVQTGNIEWDLFFASPVPFFQCVEAGYLTPLDFSRIDKAAIADLDQRMVEPFGVSSMFYAAVIGYNTRTFKGDNHPKSWADVWDAKAFPGVRILPAATYEQPPIEPALLADGVSPANLYPPDLDRAYAMLSKIRPSVAKWVNSGAAGPQALASGEADIALVNNGRIAQLRSQGAPVNYVWNQALVSAAYWAIPKGAKNIDAAHKFIEFVSRPEPQIAMAGLLPYGPVNRKAAEALPEAVKRDTPMNEANREQSIIMIAKTWGSKHPAGGTYLERSHQMWEAWARQNAIR